MEQYTEIVTAQLQSGTELRIEATVLPGAQKVAAAGKLLPLKGLNDTLVDIARDVHDAIEKVQPHKATIEFGIQVGIESGGLIALMTKGSANANLKVTLEWVQEPKPEKKPA